MRLLIFLEIGLVDITVHHTTTIMSVSLHKVSRISLTLGFRFYTSQTEIVTGPLLDPRSVQSRM